MAINESAELEFKFLINKGIKGALQAFLETVGKGLPAVVLDNRYFDTPSGFFHAHKMGLRIRGWNDQFEQTVKFAGEQQGAYSRRPEYTAPLTAKDADEGPQWHLFANIPWPAEAASNIAQQWPLLAQQFRVIFARGRWHVALADTLLEVAIDEGEIQAGDKRAAVHELEVELVAGNPAVCIAWATELQKQFGLTAGEQSKAQRGFALATGSE